MDAVFLRLLNMSISASWLVLAVMVLRLLLWKKAPKWMFCALWALVAIRLICPFSLESAFSLIPKAETVPMEIVATQPITPLPAPAPVVPEAENYDVQTPQITWETEAILYKTEPEPDGSAAITEPIAPVRTVRDWVTMFAVVWLTGAAILLGYALISYSRVYKRVRASIQVSRNVYVCDYIDTPFILGIVKPRIYLPSSLAPDSAPYVLAHEKAHIRRKDHWWKPLGFALLAIYWFNPILWIGYILLCKDIELACDEHVIRTMGSQEKKAYSRALLQCSMPKYMIAACPLAFGEVSVKERVKNVLNYRKPGFWIFLVCLLVVFVTAVCFLTNPKDDKMAANSETNPTEEASDPLDLTEAEMAAERIQDAFASILGSDSYHLFFSDETYDGSVGWQIHFYKNGEDTLWWSTDHTDEDGHMVLDGKDYTYVDGATSGWAEYKPEEDPMVSLLAEFDFEEKEITDISSVTQTDDFGETYEKVTFTVRTRLSNGEEHVQPVTAFFTSEGEMTGIRIENTSRKGADIFSFTDWSNDGYGIQERFDTAAQQFVSAEEVGAIEEPTEDELLMKEWGIDFLVEDDLLTRSGSEVWFVQKQGYDEVVSTDNSYWLEKKTANGWEKLPMIVENPKWDDANYTLGTGMYTMVYTDWSKLYGDLPSGTYRMGKTFTKQAPLKTCTGYAEFEIFYNDAMTAQQTAAVEKCYAAIEELKVRDHIHYKTFTSSDDVEEVWWNNQNYVAERSLRRPVENADGSWSAEQYETVHTASARLNGIGYASVHDTPGDYTSPITGMKLSTLTANRAGWELYSFAESLHLITFERSNEVISFPADDSCISSDKIRFHKYWTDPQDYSTLTFWFNESGKLTKMEYEAHYDDLSGYTVTYEIYDTSAAEIDAKIQASLDNLIVDTFSWRDAKAEYTDDKYNIREDSFVNNDVTTISGPADAALHAKQEYPNLTDIIGTEVFYDEDAGMWKVTFEKYVDYQRTYEYRDIYMTDSGVTVLLVYEGPVEERT